MSVRSMSGKDESLTWDTIRTLLLTEGETLSAKDLTSLLTSLMGAGMEQIPDKKCFSSDDFAEGILGFEL